MTTSYRTFEVVQSAACEFLLHWVTTQREDIPGDIAMFRYIDVKTLLCPQVPTVTSQLRSLIPVIDLFIKYKPPMPSND